ncbi:MAG: carbamate kinase [Firmicutes bacterium HGW-Firmicutes-3]|jgi:carbamate kinase|nr:MAG: carbamate kinase [Firmicutes bacterium HGW-Firmicutes-3]
MEKLAVIAIGGNSLIKDSEHQFIEDQYMAVCETVRHVVDLIELGINVVITHGNGPQVGFIMRRSEIAEEVEHMHPVPLVSCDADTQGAIGYQIQQAMQNEFNKRGMANKAVTVVTQVEVEPDDPAFLMPSKPIGTFYTEVQIERITRQHPDWHMVKDSGRGYRRVVPSPMPKKIVEREAIETLIHAGFSVVAVGGGGIPVTRDADGKLVGVNAVIDKDYASSLLATLLGADYFIISTAVDQVYIDYNKPTQKALSVLTLDEVEALKMDNQFAPGSMLPKINAASDFIKAGGKKAIITSPACLSDAVKGVAGTTIINRGDGSSG